MKKKTDPIAWKHQEKLKRKKWKQKQDTKKLEKAKYAYDMKLARKLRSII